MKKDIIYIDVEDDITAIIGKVKESVEKIVALVPPKRVGVLQSAVNLRLLQRIASQNDKRIVIITGNQALAGLAAAASIPVARNLQSKPELAEIAALEIDDGEDVIDGAQLPVSEHATQVKGESIEDQKEAALIKGINVDDEPPVATPAARPARKKPQGGKKVPNFNTFRKRLVLIIVAVVLLIGGLVWAFVFAPAATVIITARTSPASINDVMALSAQTSAEQGTIASVQETLEKEATVEFEATGEKDVGERATGMVRLSSNSYIDLVRGISIPQGTVLTSASGKRFMTDRSTVLSVTNGNSDTVGVTASENGESFNGATGSMSGAPETVVASLVDATSGGTSKKVSIVTAADVQKAKEKLVDQSAEDVKKELAGAFANTVKVIDASFTTDYADVSSSPEIGSEASDGKATLTSKVKYAMSGVDEKELTAYLEETLKQHMQDQTTQKVYSTGLDDVQLNDFTRTGDTVSVRLIATGQIGPEIDESEVKEKVAGKRFGEIQNELTKIDGVNDVDVNFSFFWVRTVPSSPDKITIEFDIQDGGE